jgi:hypothetical protein
MNKYLEKIAGAYENMNNFRKSLHEEADEIYHRDWDGHTPPVILRNAIEDFNDQSEYNRESGIEVAPDLFEVVRDHMKNRHITAGLEQRYGNARIDHADSLAHNGSAWKSLVAGAVASGAVGFASAKVTRNPLISVLSGIAAFGPAAYLTGKRALDKGHVLADEYLDKSASQNSLRKN